MNFWGEKQKRTDHFNCTYSFFSFLFLPIKHVQIPCIFLWRPLPVKLKNGTHMFGMKQAIPPWVHTEELICWKQEIYMGNILNACVFALCVCGHTQSNKRAWLSILFFFLRQDLQILMSLRQISDSVLLTLKHSLSRKTN